MSIIPDAAVSFLLNNISQILVYHYHLISDVEGNIKSLSSSLVELKALMNYFERYGHGEEYVNLTVGKMRVVIGDAEDAIETYLLQAALRDSKRWMVKVFKKMTGAKTILGSANVINTLIADIKKIQTDNANQTMQIMQHQTAVHIHTSGQLREVPVVEEDDVIGFDEAAADVIKLLIEEPLNFDVVCIVGMPGLGKTTLANKVFKDPTVNPEFPIRAFVYGSDDFDAKDVFLQIIKSASLPKPEGLKDMRYGDLAEYIHKQLKGVKYLIVVDDLWDQKHWDALRFAFPKNNVLCRVLITTRKSDLARYVSETDTSCYDLNLLSQEKSRELFQGLVFKNDNCPKKLQGYETSILERCDGLPVAIVVIASIIKSNKESDDWWQYVVDSIKDYFATNVEETGKIVNLMYKNLPKHLKPCYLYLGVFQEDSEILVWKLLRLWIAEGLIVRGDQATIELEDLAEVYFNELVDRNIVTVAQRRSNGKIRTCRMHDMQRQFCKKQAAEENLFHEIRSGNSAADASLAGARRLCLNNININEYMSRKTKSKGVRSFLTFVKGGADVKPDLLDSLPSIFKLLRVMEIEPLRFMRLPPNLCHLVLLKYLAISIDFDTLSKAFSALRFMQTLIVHTTKGSLEIKADIWNMPQFRHLHTNNASTTLPQPDKKTDQGGFQPGNDIQTLSTISPESCTKELFDRTRKLRKLGICGDLNKDCKASGEPRFFELLSSLVCLENLKLLNSDGASELTCLPSMQSFPSRMKNLTLSNTQLKWDEMKNLGLLPNLEVLKLKEYAFRGNFWVTRKGGFTSLKHLTIGRTDLIEWEGGSEDHFPSLVRLKLDGCNELNAVPKDLAGIRSFQSLELYCTSTALVSSAMEVQELKRNQASQTTKLKLTTYNPQDH